MAEKTFTGVYTDKETLARINAALPAANCRTRNEFINKAIHFYLTYLNNQSSSEFLTPALESVIAGKIGATENRIARVLFKLSVELAMMMHVVAVTNEIQPQDLADLRKLCVDEVSKLGGKYTFEDAVQFQQG